LEEIAKPKDSLIEKGDASPDKDKSRKTPTDVKKAA
jgi:hypothetical protein